MIPSKMSSAEGGALLEFMLGELSDAVQVFLSFPKHVGSARCATFCVGDGH